MMLYMKLCGALLLYAAFAKTGCPNECLCEGDTTSCRDRQLNEISQDFIDALSKRTRKLDLSGNLLVEFQAYRFKKLSMLEELNLNDNWLSAVSVDLPKFFPNLVSLSVCRNEITELPFTSYNWNLAKLDASENSVEVLRGDVFHRMPMLRHLDLSFNNIKRVNEDTFKSLKDLKTLRINGNALEILPNRTLIHQRHLHEFHAAYNFIRTIHGNTFHKNIRTIGLRANQISVFEAQTIRKNANDLDVSHNNMSKLDREFLTTMEKFKVVDMTANPIHCDCMLLDSMERTKGEWKGNCARPSNVRRKVLSEVHRKELNCYLCDDCTCNDSCKGNTKMIIILSVIIPVGIILIALIAVYLRHKKQQRAFSCVGTQMCCCCCLCLMVIFAVLSLMLWVALFMYQEE